MSETTHPRGLLEMEEKDGWLTSPPLSGLLLQEHHLAALRTKDMLNVNMSVTEHPSPGVIGLPSLLYPRGILCPLPGDKSQFLLFLLLGLNYIGPLCSIVPFLVHLATAEAHQVLSQWAGVRIP